MVDCKARRQHAQLIRQFTSGRMTAEEYEERFASVQANGKDRAVSEICDRFGSLCVDALPARMTQQWRLDRQARRKVAQAVLFLQSDEEYQWREELWDGSVFLITAFLTLLLYVLFVEAPTCLKLGVTALLWTAWLLFERARLKRRRPAGDEDAWPFLHQEDLDEAVRHPHLLNGRRRIGH